MYWLIALICLIIAWAWGGLIYVGACLTLAVGFWKVAWYNTKRVAARNAVYAALTFRSLSVSDRSTVDEAVERICERFKIDVETLGPPFPKSSAEKKLMFSGPAAVFAFRSLAMYELAIPPVGTKVPKWYVLRNPFVASLYESKSLVDKFRRQVEEEFGVSLDELNS